MQRLKQIVNRSLAALLVTIAVFAVVGYSAGRPVGRAGDPTYFIHAGQRYLAPDLLPEDPFVETGTGYDGQFFFYLAQDPLLRGKAASRDQQTSEHIDNVPYRYQRILLPVLGWVASAGGDPDLLQWSLPLINVLAVLGATLLLAQFLRARNSPTWIALAFPTSIGVLVGVFNDLSDPLAASLFLAGMVWWLEGRSRPALVGPHRVPAGPRAVLGARSGHRPGGGGPRRTPWARVAAAHGRARHLAGGAATDARREPHGGHAQAVDRSPPRGDTEAPRRGAPRRGGRRELGGPVRGLSCWRAAPTSRCGPWSVSASADRTAPSPVRTFSRLWRSVRLS